MRELNLASLNLNGAREEKKRFELYELIKIKKIDILFAQETHSDVSNEENWAREFDGLPIFSHNTSLSGGVAILFSKNSIPISYEVEEVVKGRFLQIRAQFENAFYCFGCVYAPTNAVERLGFLNIVCKTVSNCNSEDLLLIGGDFNCTEFASDRNHVEPHMASRKRLIQFRETHELVDIWWNFHKTQRHYTWSHTHNNMLSLARLDRFYGFSHQLNLFRECTIIPVSFSDHSLVQCFLTLGSIKPKSAMWHFNNRLLIDMEFRDIFRFFWNEFRTTKSDFQSLQQWWDFGKTQIKQLSQQYSYNITKELTRSMVKLEDDIKKLQESIGTEQNQELIEILNRKKKELAGILDLKAQGALIRSRFKNIEWMDVSSKFFFNLERKNGQKRCIHVLRSKEGALLSDHTEIRKRAVEFYKELYSSELLHRPNTNVFIEDLPQVTEEANSDLCREITLEELEKALQGMECGRAPGIDGLSIDFYKSFWPEIGADLLAVISESINSGRLPLSCRRAVLTLLPKKGDLSDIKNWRPVSLLCSDYKILSKALANRLSGVMEEVIHADQTYCVPGRQIFDNISFIRDMFDVSKLFGVDFGLISLDQEKAFDRIEHSYLWEVLDAFGFNRTFIDKLKVLYCDVESLLKVNGDLCAPFSVYRGIRQGCALSGMLYSLTIEPLLRKFRAELKGVIIPKCEKYFKLSAYADDIVIFIKEQSDVSKLTKILNDFMVVSSAKVNWNKSEAILIGKWLHGQPSLPAGLKWSRDGFKYLGVYLGDDATVKRNFEGIEEKIVGRLSKWKFLLSNMSYRGRVLIINNLVASTLWHWLTCIDPPALLLKKIQAILVNFFWDNLHWVPQSVLFLSKNEGGQGLIHLQSRAAAFRLKYAQRFLESSVDQNWSLVASIIFKNFEGLGLDKSLFWMNLKKLSISKLPIFYCNLFKVWSCFKVLRSEKTDSLYWTLQEPLICGSRFDVSNEGCFPALMDLLMKSHIITLGTLIRITGPVLSDTKTMEGMMKMRSTRVLNQLLSKWKGTITDEELKMIKDYEEGHIQPKEDDPFPNLSLMPDLEMCTGFFLKCNNLSLLGEGKASSKEMYECCVKAFNKKTLDGKIDTPWRNVLHLSENTRPKWGALYKSPLLKKTGDLQWRVLHGTIAVNAFVSVINHEVNPECPFCLERETVFHTFMNCRRLGPLFIFLHDLFKQFDEVFSMEIFICGFKYSKKRSHECQLFNFFLGQAKMAIYVSRKSKIEKDSDVDVILVFSLLVKSRVLVDFRYYDATNNLMMFEQRWCIKDVLCNVVNNILTFNSIL